MSRYTSNKPSTYVELLTEGIDCFYKAVNVRENFMAIIQVMTRQADDIYYAGYRENIGTKN